MSALAPHASIYVETPPLDVGEEIWSKFIQRVFGYLLEKPALQGKIRALPEELSVALVGDETMARLHEEFMGIAGPTDVLTFEHGEIVISLDTARVYAAEFKSEFWREVARYIVHGILHLLGYDDGEVSDARMMEELQEEVVAACWQKG